MTMSRAYARYAARHGEHPRLPVAVFNERRRALLRYGDFAEARCRVRRA